jgi:hypothetical protein
MVDTERMNRPTYTIVSATQHWRIIDGRVYRDHIARTRDGSLRLVAFPDGSVAA